MFDTYEELYEYALKNGWVILEIHWKDATEKVQYMIRIETGLPNMRNGVLCHNYLVAHGYGQSVQEAQQNTKNNWNRLKELYSDKISFYS